MVPDHCGAYTEGVEPAGLLFVVAADVDDLATLVLPTALAGTMRQVVLAAIRTLGKLRRRQVLMTTAITTAMAGYFALR